MKKFILYPLLFVFSLVLLFVLAVGGILFFSPTTLVNPQTLGWALEKAQVLNAWSWEKGSIDHEWKAWNDRVLKGEFKDFCIDYRSDSLDAASCMKELSWNFRVKFSFSEGFSFISVKPLTVKSDLLKVAVKDTKEPENTQASGPPDIKKYWNLLWSELVPDMDIKFDRIQAKIGNDQHETDFHLAKSAKELNLWAHLFHLLANPEGLTVSGPPVYDLPIDKKSPIPLKLRDFKFSAQMKEEGMPMQLTGAVEPIQFDFESFLELPLAGDFSSLSLRKKFLQKLHGTLAIRSIQKSIQKYGPPNYKSLPAPLNVMEGDIVTKVSTETAQQSEVMVMNAETNVAMQSNKQVLNMKIGAAVPLNVMSFKPGPISISIEFQEVTLMLPRITKTTSPPQFTPDSRISKEKAPPPQKEKPGPELDLHLEAIGEDIVSLKSNLLDEPLRMNFDIKVEKGNLQNGFLKILPLKTTVFKRPIHIKDMLIKFRHPKDPVIVGTINIPLPEYKITMKVEGPIGEPEVAFRSNPPLSQSDIYAVLLFGRPMSELAPEDKNSAQSIDRVLSQGILSLSVLYFLAGSPVEYVGYDPNSSEASAQIGLTKRSSLRVGAGSDGLSSTGVRHSLGGGWYIDTSMKKAQNVSDDGTKNYGVMLERVIAY